MEEFLTSINSVYWVLSVVVVGILINIISSYFRDGIDKILSKVSTKWSSRSAKRIERIEQEAKSLIGNILGQTELMFDEMRQRFHSQQQQVFGVFNTILLLTFIQTSKENSYLYLIFIGFFGCLILFSITVSLRYLQKANENIAILSKAKTMELSKSKENPPSD